MADEMKRDGSRGALTEPGTAPKERGILFSAPMVRAILEGRKTVTRRMVNLTDFRPSDTRGYDWTFRDRRGLWNDYSEKDFLAKCCPYGQVGGRLWVRETFRGASGYDGIPPKDWGNKPIWYEADGKPGAEWWHLSKRARPAIHMPRWASRLTLEVTGVKVERLQDITEEQAKAEGVQPNCIHADLLGWKPEEDGWINYLEPMDGGFPCLTARDSFQTLWESINGGDSWDANPWVWAVSFRVLEPAGLGVAASAKPSPSSSPTPNLEHP